MTDAISIVTPAYNCGELVKELAASIKEQARITWEWIIVDDGSAASTRDILTELAYADERIHVFHQPNRGAPAARNHGLSLARYPWIKFIDADDIMSANLLYEQIRAANESKQGIVFSPTLIIDDTTGNGDRVVSCCRGVFNCQDLLMSHLTDTSGCPGSFLIRTSLAKAAGGWDESLHADQDGDFVMRVALMHPTAAIADNVFFLHRHHYRTNRVSQGDSLEKLRSRAQVAIKLHRALESKGKTNSYSTQLASRLDRIARMASLRHPAFASTCIENALLINPRYTPADPPIINRLRSLIGLRATQAACRLARRLIPWATRQQPVGKVSDFTKCTYRKTS